ncbi:MAG: hormogonium polysaccharide biosynthesis protein HpsA [Scytolyngbya sp. HA4215-MV1]|jgi:hypothetical protein|nr:hormogonium polysaccharide biosynthesis protein HpsA [Scytolyngbya sp. HA4215-MV1]
MSNPKLAKTIQTLFRHLQKIARGMTKSFIHWLLKVMFRPSRRVSTAIAGFVLPTTVLLLLIASMTVGAIVFRAYNRTAQAIGQTQQRVIYNAATPAVDRARAKLETLFDANRDNRYPGGIPAENYLVGMLRNDGSYSVTALPGAPAADMYTLPDEQRINLDGLQKTGETRPEDNAWSFRTDTNGDGTRDATVIYSIIAQTPPDLTTGSPAKAVAGSGVVNTDDRTKATNLWVRNAPLSNRQRGNCSNASTQVSAPAQGWFADLNNSATLRKNLQVNALVIPDNANANGTFVTMEMQQDRQLDRGNKWGAWFRYDLEIFPGPQFNWNGAMHTEGSLMIQPNTGFDAYLVSAQSSCLMASADSSEVTITNIRNPTNAANQAPDFIGAAISGSMRDNTYAGSSNIHVWPATTTGPSQSVTLNTTTQSANQTNLPAALALDPVSLLTRDVSLGRGTDPSNRTNVSSTWSSLPSSAQNPRIRNQADNKPYVDDLYRADDRWGPKPRYDQIILQGASQQPGTLISTTNVTNATDFNTLVNNTPPTNDSANVGLDGYWERRALNEGMRVIVGQRLELGNAFGWSNSDALYPPNTTLSHEARQRRMLRDNLAAVQGAAIYHSANPGGQNFPVACLASTIHPGTVSTLQNSITFNNYSINGGQALWTDFFGGRGTNGWEFAVPQGTEEAFSNAIVASQPLGKALRNLAKFAGDFVSESRNGAFPPTQETGFVHPAPNMAMWGNFSELRRTLNRLDSGTSYANLSPADKTYLHTAACTLGMLAYNINTAQGYAYNNASNIGNGTSTPGLAMLGQKLFELTDGNQANGEVRDASNNYFASTGASSTPTTFVTNSVPNTYRNLPPEAFIKALQTETNLSVTSANRTELVKIAQIVLAKQQINRDRIFGFADQTLPTLSSVSIPMTVGGSATSVIYQTDCDAETFTATGMTLNQKVGLALTLCERKPRYPSLFYIFPKEDHDHDGEFSEAATTAINFDQGNLQPTTEPYIADTYIKNTVNPSATVQYQVVGSTPDDLSGVVIQPKQATFSDWLLPNSTAQNIAGANISSNLIVAPSGSTRAVGFLDRAVFNGREMMTTRMMDLDLGMLRSVGSSGTNNQPWLPISGIVYAFREDAVREDQIARPPGGLAPATTDTRSATNPVDPTLTTTAEGIRVSTKAVDYLPDPDRRPHGFRLRNGVQIKRNDSFGIPTADNIRGLSLFTDNPVYIQGNFNLHQLGADNTVGTRIEEFTQKLVPGLGANGTYSQSQFYGRTTLDPDFAQPARDRWRPTEILADAISILSDNFCDGSLEDTFTSAVTDTITASTYHNATVGLWSPGCSGATVSSFLDQNRPTAAPTWARENVYDATSPVRIDRNGTPQVNRTNPLYGSSSGEGYDSFSTGKPLRTASDTTVNAIVVSGIVPSRANQAYGGLHNFPRFLENWGSQNLWFNGSFLQLNFSNAATAPFDQDSWEPPLATASTSEVIPYYSPPRRIWGYDPGLQLAPAGPAAARFIIASKNRNEFYKELPINDPYINRLCNAFNATPKTGILAGAVATINCPN